jgi:hypothetical protein
MIRQIKRYFAINAYVYRLSQEMARRFEVQNYYTIDQVTHTVEVAKFSKVFLAYAHAMYCSRTDFNAYYEPLQVRCNYDDLRRAVARRINALNDFNAATVICATKRASGSFYESNLGNDPGTPGGH